LPFTVAYDSECGPCTRFREAVEFLDAKGSIAFVGLGQADRSGLLEPVEVSRRRASFHLISPEGRVWSGARALPPLAGILPGGSGVSYVLGRNPMAFRLAAFAYEVLSRLHDSGSCTHHPGGRGQLSGKQIDLFARGNSHLSL
jgi:predicted DCC family thiol-disulfide oxidoreductase YuxK